MEPEQIVALYLLSTRHGKAGAEKVEHSLLNADPATVRQKQKEKLFHIGSTSVLFYIALFVLKDLKAILSLANTGLSYHNEKK